MMLWKTGNLKRLNILEGSVSSGKTWISLVLWAFFVASMPEDKLYMMTAKSLTTLKRNCLVLLQELVGEDNFSFSMAQKEGRLFGRRILLEGASDIRSESKIRGLTLQGAYLDEATQAPRDFFAMLLSRLRLQGAKLIATTNPENPLHWLKVEYLDRAEELSLLDMKFLLEDNTTLPREYVENIKREYTGVFYDRFILGKWTQAEGLIYPMYADALEYPPTSRAEKYALSIDYGTQNAFAAILWGKHGNTWYQIKEYYYSGRDERAQKTDEEYAQDLDKFITSYVPDGCERSEWPLKYLTSGQKLLTIIDPSAASFIAVLRKRRFYKVLRAHNSVLDGIRETATAMHIGRLKINPDCTATVAELQNYVWDSKAAEDRPIKANDHACDAMRYMVFTLHIAKKHSEGTASAW